MKKPVILIVDDQPNWREVFVELLKNEYEIVSAGSYSDAREIIKGREVDFFDVAIIDVRLDDKDQKNEQGLGLVEVLNCIATHTNTIIVTGYPRFETVSKAYKDLNVFACVEKYPEDGSSFNNKRFRDLVREAALDSVESRQLPSVFTVMPFAKEYTDIYESITKRTIESCGLISIRGDDFFLPHRIMDDIRRSTRAAAFIIADVSDRNPNVFYEVGMAHALNKAVLLLTRSVDDVPPQLRDIRSIEYKDTIPGSRRLEKSLRKAIEELKRNNYQSQDLFAHREFQVDQKFCFCLKAPTKLSKIVFDSIVENTLRESGYQYESPASVFSTKHIMDEIWGYLNRAGMIIADLSSRDPEVFYMVGLAHGLNKQVVLLAESEEDIPFDLRGPSHILYSKLDYKTGSAVRAKLIKILDLNSRQVAASSGFNESELHLAGNTRNLEKEMGQLRSVEDDFSITWLHISDLHFRRPNYEADIVLQDLIKDVEKQIRDQDFQLDFIVVTGDVAFRSVPSEYGRAAEFFDQLLAQSGIEKDRLFIVPGNHDVHWTTIKNQGDFPEECVKACGTIAGVNRFLGSTQNLRRVLSKFQHYRRFIKEYFTEDNIMFQSLDNRQLFFVAPIEAGGKRVNLIGLNSAWMSAYNWKPRQYLNKADDERNLIVGERQLRDALNEVDEQQNDIIIAAMHHPIDWLNPYERERIGGLLPRNCNMLLHGHLHQSGIVGHTGPSGKITTIAAGASYLNVEESLSYTGYNFVQLNPDNDQGTIYMRRYSKRHGGFWTTDTSYPDMPDGLYPFTL